MGEEQKLAGLPVDASRALERLLSQENQISDLIALLATLDPELFLDALDLPVRKASVKREVRLSGHAGNADLIVSSEDGPIALLEIKSSAAQHGNQFKRYDAWAVKQSPQVRCYLIALDGESLGAPDNWTTESLPRLVRRWEGSSNPNVAWLASAAADVFDRWTAQADGRLASAAGPIVGDLVARRIETAVLTADSSRGTGIQSWATRQLGGGAAMVVARLPFPESHPGAWVCADLRSTVRDHPAAPWVLRLGAEVESSDQSQARVAAHDLTKPILDALTCTAVREALRQVDEEELAASLKPRARTRDGLRTRPNEQSLSEWRRKATAGAIVNHPVLANDNLGYGGYRLGSLIEIDVTSLDRNQLARLMLAALAHVRTELARQPEDTIEGN